MQLQKSTFAASHMKSSVFQHIFNYISTYAYVFSEYLLCNFNNLSIKFHVMLQKMKGCSCYSNKYNEIKICDLELFSEIRSQLLFINYFSKSYIV